MIHQYTIAHFPIWIKLLFRHGVALSQIPRAFVITIVSFALIPIHVINHLIFLNKKKQISNTKDPIFILGHWRSGTTFLQYLMGKDDQFGYLTYYQAFMPTLLWAGGTFLKRFLESQLPDKRYQDNVIVQSDLPTEEENPLSTMSEYSASHSFYFPKDEHYYNKYILYKGLSKEEKSKWQKAYLFMLQHIQARFPSKQLLIKNPHNTGRVKELLELFPKAKFIFIHRTPREVIPSTIRMYDKVVKLQYMQAYSDQDTENKIFYYHNSILKRYFEYKANIPTNQIIEISYEDLLKDASQTVHRIYKKLELHLSNSAIERMSSFIKDNEQYETNQHTIKEELEQRIQSETQWFEDWRNKQV